MQTIAEDEEYLDGDSSLSELDHYEQNKQEEEEDEEEYNVFQNADTSEYFDNFPHHQQEENTDEEENMVIGQHNDEQPADFVADLPVQETTAPDSKIPWQRVEPKRVTNNQNDFYQENLNNHTVTPSTHPKINSMSICGLGLLCLVIIIFRKTTKGHTDLPWSNKDEKDYSLPLHNRHFKSEMKNC
ncbi:hypothetical protein BY458DRAFT_492127 [Sporodiniella umbellata]|nr:hypothetical protein BY458DRAFT_492127 [Sporodiniella umbellata]